MKAALITHCGEHSFPVPAKVYLKDGIFDLFDVIRQQPDYFLLAFLETAEKSSLGKKLQNHIKGTIESLLAERERLQQQCDEIKKMNPDEIKKVSDVLALVTER